MKTTLKLMLSTATVAVLAMTSCKKETNVVPDVSTPQQPVNGTNTMKNFFSQNGAQKQSFSINASITNVVTSIKSTKLNIPANSFVTKTGTPVTGNVTIELTEIYSKKDMILSGAPTTTNGRLLISGGEMFIRAIQNGQELRLANNSNVALSAPINGASSNYMTEYYASTLADSSDWTQTFDSSDVVVTYDSIPTSGGGYTVTPTYTNEDLDSLNWVNFDFLYDFNFPGQQTSIDITVDSQFNYSNCAVFVSINGTNSVSKADSWGGSAFYDSYLPVGQGATIVAIAEINGQYYSAFLPTTIAANQNITLSLTATTLAQIQSQLSTLP